MQFDRLKRRRAASWFHGHLGAVSIAAADSARGCPQKLRIGPCTDDQHKHDQVEGSHDLLGGKMLSFIAGVSKVSHWTISFARLVNRRRQRRVSYRVPSALEASYSRASWKHPF